MANQFSNDGSFMAMFMQAQGTDTAAASRPPSDSPKTGPDTVTAAAHNGDEGRSARPRVKRRFEEGPPVLSAAAAAAAVAAAAAAGSGSPGALYPAGGGGTERVGLGGGADDDGEEAEAAARRAAEHQEEQLVVSAWGKRYKAGHAPKSSHVGNLLPEDDLRKYTTLLPWNKAAAAAAGSAGDGADAASAAGAAGAGAGAAIDESNVGHRLLSKMGWSAGKGLGASESGAVAPVAALQSAAARTGVTAGDMSGLGAQHTWDLTGEEDMFDQYRKRMMLGYRHRPNPNNNPRKLYY